MNIYELGNGFTVSYRKLLISTAVSDEFSMSLLHLDQEHCINVTGSDRSCCQLCRQRMQVMRLI